MTIFAQHKKYTLELNLRQEGTHASANFYSTHRTACERRCTEDARY